MAKGSPISEDVEHVNNQLAAKDEEIKQLKKQLKTFANKTGDDVSSDHEVNRKLAEYQSYMANYMIKASEDKARAVTNAEAALKTKYESKIENIIQSYESKARRTELSSLKGTDASNVGSVFRGRETSDDGLRFSAAANPQGPEPSLSLYQNEQVKTASANGNLPKTDDPNSGVSSVAATYGEAAGFSESAPLPPPMIGGDFPRASMEQPAVYKGRSHIPTNVVSRDDPFRPVSVDGSQSTLLKPPTSAGNRSKKVSPKAIPSSPDIRNEESMPVKANAKETLQTESEDSLISNNLNVNEEEVPDLRTPLDPATIPQVGGVVPPISSVEPLGPDAPETSIVSSFQAPAFKNMPRATSPTATSDDSSVGGVVAPISKAHPLGPDGLYANAAPSRSVAVISGVVE